MIVLINWKKIRNEYINGYISCRELAEKYNVNKKTVSQKCKEEGWCKKRAERRKKVVEKADEKIVEKLAEREAERLLRISDIADRLLEKIDIATGQLDKLIKTTKTKDRQLEYYSGKLSYEKVRENEEKDVCKIDCLDRQGIKQLTSSLRDIKELMTKVDDNKAPESPNINITVSAATPDDKDEEDD